jgi:transposase
VNTFPYKLEDFDFIVLSRTEKNPRARVRLLMLAQLATGTLPAVIATQFGFHPITVRKLRRVFLKTGLSCIYDKAGRGRKYTLPDEQHDAFKRAVIEAQQQLGGGRLTGNGIIVILQDQFKVNYSLNGVYALLKKLDLSWISGRSAHSKRDE